MKMPASSEAAQTKGAKSTGTNTDEGGRESKLPPFQMDIAAMAAQKANSMNKAKRMLTDDGEEIPMEDFHDNKGKGMAWTIELEDLPAKRPRGIPFPPFTIIPNTTPNPGVYRPKYTTVRISTESNAWGCVIQCNDWCR